MTRNEQVILLNTTVKCILGVSKISGVGVIAIRDISKGNRCFVRRMKGDTQAILDLTFSALKEVDEDIREMILGRWPNIYNGQQFYHPNDDARLLSFVNHSDAPNFNPINDTAIRDIKAGEEITENYRTVENYKEIYKWLN